MLKQRVLTAILLGGLTVAVVCYGSHYLFSLLVGFFIFTAALEWAGLCNGGHVVRVIYAVMVTAAVFILFTFLAAEWMLAVYITGAIWWCVAGVMVIAYQYGRQVVPENRFLKYLIGGFVFLPAALSLLCLYDENNGPARVLLLFVLIWVVDCAAFFIGGRFGKVKLADRVSPGKSLEGLAGSLAAAALLALPYSASGVSPGLNTAGWIVILTVTAGFSAIGDLYESMFKRIANLKDSGRLLPGHGGMLDRIDSLTAAAPFYNLGLWLLEAR